MRHSPVQTLAISRPTGRAHALVLAAIIAAGALVTAAGPVRAAGGDGLRNEANEWRTDPDKCDDDRPPDCGGGRQPVVGTALLDDIATHRAQRMANDNKMEHDLAYVSQRLNQSGVCWSGYGEIIAWERGYPEYSYERTLGLWWDSPTHHAVMMTPDYNAAGAAWDTASDGGHYSVMVFVTLCGSFATGSSVKPLYPDDRYNPGRELVLKPGRVTGYRFDADGNVLSRKTVRFRSTTRGTSGGRAHVNGKDWLKVSTGSLAGYWVHETTETFVRGLTERKHFDPHRRITADAGRYIGWQFDWLGRVTATRTDTFSHTRHPAVYQFAIINGRRYFRFSSGKLEGFWVRDTGAIDSH